MQPRAGPCLPPALVLRLQRKEAQLVPKGPPAVRSSGLAVWLGLVLDRLFFFFFLHPHLQHMRVPRLGVKSELQLLATATATQDPSHVCNLRCSLWQCQILTSLSEARDQTCMLTETVSGS